MSSYYYRKYTCRELGIDPRMGRRLPGIAQDLGMELNELLAYMAGKAHEQWQMPYEPLPMVEEAWGQTWDDVSQAIGAAMELELSGQEPPTLTDRQRADLGGLVAIPIQGLWPALSNGNTTELRYRMWRYTLEQYSPWVTRDPNVYEMYPALMVAGGQLEIAHPHATRRLITLTDVHHLMTYKNSSQK